MGNALKPRDRVAMATLAKAEGSARAAKDVMAGVLPDPEPDMRGAAVSAGAEIEPEARMGSGAAAVAAAVAEVEVERVTKRRSSRSGAKLPRRRAGVRARERSVASGTKDTRATVQAELQQQEQQQPERSSASPADLAMIRAKEAMIQAHRAKAMELMREADEAEAELGSQL